MMVQWKDVEALSWWLANKFSRQFPSRRPDELIGSVGVAFAKCAESYDPSRGVEFTSYFARAAHNEVLRFISNDGEKLASGKQVSAVSETDEPTLERDTAGWTDEVLGMFDTMDDLWSWLVRGVDPKLADVLRMRYREKLTMLDVASHLGCSKSNIQRLEAMAIAAVRERLRAVRELDHLFAAR